MARSRRIYNKVNNNFKLNKINFIFKRRLLLRFRIKNMNPVRSFYFNLSIMNSNLLKSSIKISRNFLSRKKRYKFIRRSRKKKLLLIKSKSLRNSYFITKKKKLRLFNIRNLRNSLLAKSLRNNLNDRNTLTNSLYKSSKLYKLPSKPRVSTFLKFYKPL